MVHVICMGYISIDVGNYKKTKVMGLQPKIGVANCATKHDGNKMASG